MSDYEFVFSEDGPALVLAGASIVAPNTRSGNPRHEVGSGRFGTGPGEIDRRQRADRRVLPRRQDEGQRPDQLRRRDAVVDAAREIVDLSDEKALRDFMRKRWSGSRAMTETDVQAFFNDVRSQRIEDVLDWLDNRVRVGVLKRSKVANISFPRGWVKSTLRGLSDPEIKMVLSRLRTRGWTEQEVRQHVIQRFDDDHKRLARLRASVEVS